MRSPCDKRSSLTDDELDFCLLSLAGTAPEYVERYQVMWGQMDLYAVEERVRNFFFLWTWKHIRYEHHINPAYLSLLRSIKVRNDETN
jgi:hypothetical protein